MLTNRDVFNEVRRILGSVCSWHGHWATSLGVLRVTHAPINQSQLEPETGVQVLAVLRCVLLDAVAIFIEVRKSQLQSTP
jgi:hypothetical protein